MAAGDRSKNGKASDIVIHYCWNAESDYRVAFCNRKQPGYATSDWSEVSCKKCLVAKDKSDRLDKHLPDGPSMAQAYHDPKISY